MFKKKKKDQQELMLGFVKILADNQEATVKQLETLNKLLENGSLGKLAFDSSGFSVTSKLDSIQVQLNNCVTPTTVEEYVEGRVQKEILYNKDYDKRYEKNKDLIAFIETYCKFEDKYEVLNLFDMIDSKYDIKKKKQ